VVAGDMDYEHFALARYLPNGRLDRGFGARGRVLAEVGEEANTVAVQPNGKNRGRGEWGFALSRVDSSSY
jgi:hypothetical protein